MFQALDEELALCGNSLKQQGEISGQVGPPPGGGRTEGWLAPALWFLATSHHPEAADQRLTLHFHFKQENLISPFYRESKTKLICFCEMTYIEPSKSIPSQFLMKS